MADEPPPSRIASHGDGIFFSRGHARAPPKNVREKVDKWISTSPPPTQANVGRVVATKQLRPGAYTIKAHIISGAGMRGVDFGTHSCDPFIKIRVSNFSGSVNAEANTSTKSQTLDPVFNEVRIFHLPTLDTHAINDLKIRLEVRACDEPRRNRHCRRVTAVNAVVPPAGPAGGDAVRFDLGPTPPQRRPGVCRPSARPAMINRIVW